jgi:gluconolactonase
LAKTGTTAERWAPLCTNVAIGGVSRERLYMTESAPSGVLVADIGEL